MKRALTSLGGLDVDSSSATYLCHEVGPSLDLLGSHPRSVENPAVVRLLEQGLAPSRCSVNTRWHLPSPPTQTPHPPEPLPHLPHLCPLCPVPRTRRHSRPSLGSPLPSLQKGLAERHSSPLFLGRIHAGRLCPQPLSPSALHLAGTHHLEVPSSALAGALQYLLPHHSSGACFFLHGCPSSALASSSDQRGSVLSSPSPPFPLISPGSRAP